MSRLIGWIYIQKEGSCDNREGGFVDFFVSAPKFELYCKDGQYPSPVTQMIKPFLIISVKSRNEWSVCINLGFRSFRPQVGSAQVVPTQVDPAPSRSDPKLKVDSAPLEIKYF